MLGFRQLEQVAAELLLPVGGAAGAVPGGTIGQQQQNLAFQMAGAGNVCLYPEAKLLQDLLGLCSVVVREVPLPLGCSNAGCVSMVGRSETATADWLCTKCRVAIYCSSDCQKVHGEQHKGACRKIAAGKWHKEQQQ